MSIKPIDHHDGLYGVVEGLRHDNYHNPLNFFDNVPRIISAWLSDNSKVVLTFRAQIIHEVLYTQVFVGKWKSIDGSNKYVMQIINTFSSEDAYNSSWTDLRSIFLNRLQPSHIVDFFKEIAKQHVREKIPFHVVERCFKDVPFKRTLGAIAFLEGSSNNNAATPTKTSVVKHFRRIEHFYVGLHEYEKTHHAEPKTYVVDTSLTAHLSKNCGTLLSACGHVGGGSQPLQTFDIQKGLVASIKSIVSASMVAVLPEAASAIGLGAGLLSAFVIEVYNWCTLSPPKELAPFHNLTEMMLHGGQPPLSGLDHYISKIFAAWASKKHVLLVGSSDAVQTMVLLELARRLSEINETGKPAPKELKGAHCFLGSAALLAGNANESNLEQFQKIVAQVEAHREQVILALFDIDKLLKPNTSTFQPLQDILDGIYRKLRYFICTVNESEFKNWAKYKFDPKKFEIISISEINKNHIKLQLYLKMDELAPERRLDERAADLLAESSLEIAVNELVYLIQTKIKCEKTFPSEQLLADLELKVATSKAVMNNARLKALSPADMDRFIAEQEDFEKQKKELEAKLIVEKARFKKFEKFKKYRLDLRTRIGRAAVLCHKVYKKFETEKKEEISQLIAELVLDGVKFAKNNIKWQILLNEHAFLSQFLHPAIDELLSEMEQEIGTTVDIDLAFVQSMRKEPKH